MAHDRNFGTVVGVLIIEVILAAGAWAQNNYKTLHGFKGGRGGSGPFGLVFDQTGNLYGPLGDGQGPGAVFKLTPKAGGGWTESVLYRFTGEDGETDGGLIFDQAGNLYGTTTGGTAEAGRVFELTQKQDGNWTKKVLYNFCSLSNCADGEGPNAALTLDQQGNLYGTTMDGGAEGSGTVFKLAPNSDGSWTESVLYSFTFQDGASPFGGLVFDATGSLYGTTAFGGYGPCNGGCGVVFQLTPNSDGSWKDNVLYYFMLGKDGNQPFATLIFDKTGSLYGTTTLGGNSHCGAGWGCGVVFKLSPSQDGSWKEETLHSFAGGGGEVPYSSLILDQGRNLYGTTIWGGDLSDCNGNGCGVVFKLAPNADGSWKETVLHAFHDHPGARPYSGLIFDTAGTLYGTTAGDDKTTFGSVFKITP
jgi:uncharacterized repeat protein (TIGR03803 family)